MGWRRLKTQLFVREADSGGPAIAFVPPGATQWALKGDLA
jgi:hypothetical protein